MHPLGSRPLIRRRGEPEPDVDTADHQHVVFGFFDLPGGRCGQPLPGRLDPARLQRASEGAGESARGGGDHVVERGRVRLNAAGRDLVMLGDRTMDAKHHRLTLTGQIRAPDGAPDTLNGDFGTIHNAIHGAALQYAVRLVNPSNVAPVP